MITTNTSSKIDGLNDLRRLITEDELLPPSYALSFLTLFDNNDSTRDQYPLNHQRLSPIQFFLSKLLLESNLTLQRFTNVSMSESDVDTENQDHQSSLDDLPSYLNLYIGGYAILFTACIGLVLNVSGIFLLSRKKGYKNILNMLRIINLMADTIYLVFQAIRAVDTNFPRLSRQPSASYYILTNSAERFTCIASVLSFIALNHCQYKAVEMPFWGRRITMDGSVRRKQLMKYLLPIIFLATFFTLPIIFEVDTEIDLSSEEKTALVIPSEMRLNPFYSAFLICGLNILLLGLLPFVSLLYFAYNILHHLNRRHIFTESRHQDNNDLQTKAIFVMFFTFIFIIFIIINLNFLILLLFPLTTLLYFTYCATRSLKQKFISIQIKHEVSSMRINGEQRCNNKASKTAVVLIVVFIFLHSLRFVTSVGEFVVLIGKNKTSDLQHGMGIPVWLEIVVTMGNLCMVINASVNYVIYHYLNASTICNRISRRIKNRFNARSCLHQNFVQETNV